METLESNYPGNINNTGLLLTHDDHNSLSSYGACRDVLTATVDTPSQKNRFRLWTVTCSCLVAIQTWFIYGYAIGYTDPILNDLGTLNSTYTSLSKTSYQDTFSVSNDYKLSMVYTAAATAA